MAKQQLAKIEPQKAPYVTPRILTLKVSLSFASSADSLNDIFGLVRPQSLEPDKPEIPQNKRAGRQCLNDRKDTVLENSHVLQTLSRLHPGRQPFLSQVRSSIKVRACSRSTMVMDLYDSSILR